MADDSDHEWKYSIEDVGEDAEDDAKNGGPEATADDRSEPEAIDRRVEPGSPSLENAIFVALGALLALGTIAFGLGLL